MRPFGYQRAVEPAGAVAAVDRHDNAVFLAGGSNLVDHLRLGVARPDLLVDISRLPMTEVEETEHGLRVGANVRNSDLAAHPAVRRDWPVVARAVLAGASGQIRNQATTAGNLLQRTRCVYFQDVTTPCNKREPGSGCSALDGYGHDNAVLGTSPDCVAVHPSDLAVGLAVVEPEVRVLGAGGERALAFADLHRLPGEHPEQDTTLRRGELITGLTLPRLAEGSRSTYVKVRDRASYAFALVSVAAVLRLDGDTVEEARVGWGGVAHKPWRARALEEALTGTALSRDAVAAGLDAELAEADPGPEAAYKLPLLRRTTAMVLADLAGKEL